MAKSSPLSLLLASSTDPYVPSPSCLQISYRSIVVVYILWLATPAHVGDMSEAPKHTQVIWARIHKSSHTFAGVNNDNSKTRLTRANSSRECRQGFTNRRR